MCDQMIYAEIFHFNCEPHISGWAWAYIAASDKKKKEKKCCLTNVSLWRKHRNKNITFQHGVYFTGFYRMKWSWKLKIRFLHTGHKAELTGSGPGCEQYNKKKKKLGEAGEVITKPVGEGHLDYIITS